MVTEALLERRAPTGSWPAGPEQAIEFAVLAVVAGIVLWWATQVAVAVSHRLARIEPTTPAMPRLPGVDAVAGVIVTAVVLLGCARGTGAPVLVAVDDPGVPLTTAAAPVASQVATSLATTGSSTAVIGEGTTSAPPSTVTTSSTLTAVEPTTTTTASAAAPTTTGSTRAPTTTAPATTAIELSVPAEDPATGSPSVSPPPPDTPPPASASLDEVVVVEGDNLWAISADVLEMAWGRPASCPEIARFWRSVVAGTAVRSGDPDLIHPGERLRLPTVPTDPQLDSAVVSPSPS